MDTRLLFLLFAIVFVLRDRILPSTGGFAVVPQLTHTSASAGSDQSGGFTSSHSFCCLAACFQLENYSKAGTEVVSSIKKKKKRKTHITTSTLDFTSEHSASPRTAYP